MFYDDFFAYHLFYIYRDEFNNLPIFQTSNDVTESFNDLYESLADPPNRRSRRRVSELDSSNLIFLQESLDYTDKFVERVAAFDNLDVMLVNFSGQPQVLIKLLIVS